MEYPQDAANTFQSIEKKWKQYWKDNKIYKVSNTSEKPKYYILDMFPYPSGAGLHVGHPLGYIASDIFARYKRLKGFNVLHPMGFDAFGLPAEQYAIETGQHPAVTTEKNIARYKEQLDNIGFCYDWDREVRTSDPKYYKWTQWIFLQLFHSWYDRTFQRARSIKDLVAIFEKEGNGNVVCPEDEQLSFDAAAWANYSEKEKRGVLMQYRIGYLSYAEVWWCEALGTVLANDEVVNGVSERGGHPVVKKQMRQWFLRITEYADRLLKSLDTLEWTEAMKEMQRNWIGKSEGAEVGFQIAAKTSPPALSEGEGGVAYARGNDGVAGWNTADPLVYDGIKDFRKNLKDNQTEAEGVLWQALRNNQLGVKFRRQHVIGKFIADFVCLSKRLVIEVDGGIHEHQQEDDAIRTSYLEEKGFTVIRFTNEQVIVKTDEVVETIKDKLKTQSTVEDSDCGTTQVPSFGGDLGEVSIKVFTTRPDTIFGVDFMVLAPEHELVDEITTEEQRAEVNKYKEYVQSRSERERMSEVKTISGAFTGAYAVHPFTGKHIPVWISEYVLAGYGTGAIMAVPSGDDRDHAFAKHFNIPITNIFGEKYNGETAYTDKQGVIENSDFLSGKDVKEALPAAIQAIVDKGIGRRRVNYRLRDAGFSRQRYWGEPFPIIYDLPEETSPPALSEGEGGVAQREGGVPYGVDEPLFDDRPELQGLPVELPMVEHYKPGPEGQGPLANIEDWVTTSAGVRETNTMPGYAGSSWYFLRYMDPHNEHEFADRAATDYWNQVDVYIGGTEHAVGHLLYSRMWTKALCDLGYISFDEPFRRLVNQGMIQGSSRFVYRVGATNVFVSHDKLKDQSEEVTPLHVDVNIVDGLELDIEAFKNWKPEYADAQFILNEQGKYVCGAAVEKMSKRWFNVVNPDDIVAQYGADTFRMYEMFLGPLDVSKPWDTKGIEGVHRFLKKLCRLYFDEVTSNSVIEETPATEVELRTLHKTIKKVGDDIERFSFNTAVSQFMICVNELTAANTRKKEILEPLVVVIAPFAPHLAEELWHRMGNETSVLDADFPTAEEKYLIESSKKYPVAVNGKTRAEIEFPLDATQEHIEKEVLADAEIIKWMDGKAAKKIIFVQGRMINVVV